MIRLPGESSRWRGWARSAALADPGEPADRVALRLLLLGFGFFIPLWIGGAELLGYSASMLGVWIACRRGGAGVRRADWLWPMALYAVFCVVAAVAGWNPARALPRLNRLLLLPLVIAPATALAGLPRERAAEWSVRCLAAFLAGATLKACYDLGRIPLGAALGEWLYGLGNMRDPQFYLSALLLWMAISCGGSAPAGGRTRAFALLAAAAGLVLHFKRGVWLAFGIAAATLCVLYRRRAFVALALATGVALLLPPVRARWSALGAEFAPGASRRVLWTRIAPKMIRENPWGVGRGVIRNKDLQRYGRLRETNLNHLHNNGLQIAVESGWGGVAAWIVWMVWAAVEMAWNAACAARRRHPCRWVPIGIGFVFLGLMLNGWVEYNFGDSEIYMWLLLLLGVSRLWSGGTAPAAGPPSPKGAAA